MWPFFVILLNPVFRYLSCFIQGFKKIHIQNFISVSAIESLVIFLILGIIDGVPGQLDNGILRNFQRNSEAIIWIEGFLTSIVATYFGVPAWRPNS